MLQMIIPDKEVFNEKTEEFEIIKGCKLEMEHSLLSISKWESKWNKPFFSNKSILQEKTKKEILDYIRCMTLTKNVDSNVYNTLTNNEIKKIEQYISAPMTATTFSNERKGKGGNGETITSELIYYWMIAFNIPQEYQKWHINRLLTLIRICEIKNAPPKKMSRSEIMSRNRALNEARKSKYHTRG